MARTASPVTAPATIAVDTDGDDFALDFGMTELTGKPAAPAVETDKVAAALAAEVTANHFRHEHYVEQGKLPA